MKIQVNYKLWLIAFITVQTISISNAVPPLQGTYDPVTKVFYSTGLPIAKENSVPGPMKSRDYYRGLKKYPVLFIHGSDKPYTFTVDQWAAQLYTVDTYPSGSIRDYYREVSAGRFDMDGDVRGWYTSMYPYSHYTEDYGESGGAEELVTEAVNAAESEGFDWAQYDNDGDGSVDAVCVIHQGGDAADGTANQIWSHCGGLSTPLVYDGVTIGTYSIQSETMWDEVTMQTIGTYCHEFGHILGLPDLYDVSYTTKPDPITKWCIMSSGSSIGNPMGSKPGHMCVWSKYKLGWVDPIIIETADSYTITATQGSSSNCSYILRINSDPKEYFIIENRWKEYAGKFDHLPSIWEGGLLIYHADENNQGSNDGNDPFWMLAVEDAEPHRDAQDQPNKNNFDAAFSLDTGKTLFGPTTEPNTSGNYHPSKITVSDISARGQTMSFQTSFEPNFVLGTYDVFSHGAQQYHLIIRLDNLSVLEGPDVTATLSTNATNVVIDSGVASFGTIPGSGGSASNQSNPFTFHTTDTVSTFEIFSVVPQWSGSTGTELTMTVPVNPNDILIVDDDQTRQGQAQNVEVFYQEALDLLPLTYNTWEVLSLGYPSASILKLYSAVIWSDGKSNQNAPVAGAGLDILRDYLDMHGNLFWSSHEFLYSQYPFQDDDFATLSEGQFAYDYLHISQIEQDEYFYTASGVSGTIFEGLTFDFEDVFSGTNLNWWPDEFVPDAQAISILTAGAHECEPDDTYCEDDALPANNILNSASCALLYHGDYNLMFMTIPVHGLSTETEDPLNRQSFISSIFDWFDQYPTPTPPPPTITPPPTFTPTMTPTHQPSATPSPGCPATKVTVTMPSHVFHPGDPCSCTAVVCNSEGTTISGYPLFVILDVYGALFFAPSFNQVFDTYLNDNPSFPPGETSVTVLEEFPWPAGITSMAGIWWYAALTNPEMDALFGDYSAFDFGWEL